MSLLYSDIYTRVFHSCGIVECKHQEEGLSHLKTWHQRHIHSLDWMNFIQRHKACVSVQCFSAVWRLQHSHYIVYAQHNIRIPKTRCKTCSLSTTRHCQDWIHKWNAPRRHHHLNIWNECESSYKQGKTDWMWCGMARARWRWNLTHLPRFSVYIMLFVLLAEENCCFPYLWIFELTLNAACQLAIV